VSSSQSKKKMNLSLGESVPYEIRSSDEHEVDHYDVILIRPPIQVVNRVFEYHSQVIDCKNDSQQLQCSTENTHKVQEVDTTSMQASFQIFQDMVAA